MKHFKKLILASLTVSTAAFAQPKAGSVETEAAPTTTSPPGTIWLGGALQVASPSSDGLNGQNKSDFDMAYGVMATGDYQVNDIFTVRAMPRYVMSIKPSQMGGGGSSDSSSAYDLRAGATAGKDVTPKIRLYGLGALGYSSISFPSSTQLPGASGLTVTVGAGGTYMINPKLRVYAEAAYEAGFQSMSAMGQSADYKMNFLDIGAGVQLAVGH